MTLDYKNQKIDVANLKPGMFVAEPDRSWLDLPFLMQGFVIEDEKQIKTFQKHCEWVIVDRTKSIGTEYAAPTKEKIAKHQDVVVSTVTVANDAQKNKKITPPSPQPESKNTFLEILRELKNYKENPIQQSSSSPQENKNHRTLIEKSTNPSAIKSEDSTIEENSLTSDTNFLNALKNTFSWFKRNKPTYQDVIDDESSTQEETTTLNGYKITIYEEAPPVEEEIERILPSYERAQVATREIFEALSKSQNLDISHLGDALDDIAESVLRTPDALIWLSKLKQTDSYTYNHSLSVSINLMAFASFLSFDKEKIKELGMAGLLQDVGKAKVPAEILNKSTTLTAEEIDLVRKHVDEGMNILEQNSSIPSSVILLVAQHHERIDGSGYPYGLKNKQISLDAQMAGLIDTYCALTTTRPYAKGLFNQQALEEIHKRAGKAFSSQLVDQLVQFLGMYPVSTLVELNTGEVGVVIQQNQIRRLQPRVMILLDSEKNRIAYPVVINLLYAPSIASGDPYKIIRSLPPDSYGLNPDDFYASTLIAA